ncbi:MAG: type II toxin-antitoxin system VapC family toxin [Caldilineaceae bacterium]
MSVYVVDASVFVADARPSEPHHFDANTFLKYGAATQSLIYTPTIVLPEIAAAIARGHQRPTLAQRLVKALQGFPHIKIIPIEETLANLAAELAAQSRIRGCDAIYVALAQSKNAILITLDQEQKSRTPSSITVRTPGEEVALLRPPPSTN